MKHIDSRESGFRNVHNNTKTKIFRAVNYPGTDYDHINPSRLLNNLVKRSASISNDKLIQFVYKLHKLA